MFYSLRPDGQFDDFSLHGACPVIAGEKDNQQRERKRRETVKSSLAGLVFYW